jgi:hypothetical protein
MTWIEKIAAQIKRLGGVEVSASSDTSEAELLSQLEALPAMAQAVESSDAFVQLQDRLTALEGLVSNLPSAEAAGNVTAEDLAQAIEAAVSPLNDQLLAANTTIEALTATVATQKTELSKSINAVKLASAKAQTHTPDPAPGAGSTDDDNDDDSITMDMSNFVTSSSIIPGLNFKTLK